MHFTTSKTRKMIFAPLLIITEWLGKTSPEILIKLRYLARFHKLPKLNNPKDLNEKMLFLSLKTDTTIWTKLADKHAVRKYIEDKGLGEILNPEYALYNSVDEIDLKSLPNSFVMKTTHGSGGVLITKDKSKLDEKEVRKDFAGQMKPYGALEGARHYLRIEPRITVEALMENDEESAKYSSSIIDYKVWCFNGVPTYIWACCNRKENTTEVMTYDLNWKEHPEWSIFNHNYKHGVLLPKPKNFDYMIEVCRKLAEGFPCVSVDLYNFNGKVKFGEMTFTRYGGMMNFFTQEFLNLAGSQVNLNK